MLTARAGPAAQKAEVDASIMRFDTKLDHTVAAAVAVGTSPQAHGTMSMQGVTVHADTVIFAGTAGTGQPAVDVRTSATSVPPSRPTPRYPDAHTQLLSEKLEAAKTRRLRLREHARDTADLDREVLDLKRQLREGGQLRAGDSLGDDDRYELLELLGRGGFASVWMAYDNQRHTSVAIKVLHSNLAGDRVRLDRFKRGARIMAKLEHEAVVRVLEPYGEDGGWHYFVMEHMRGGDLRSAVVEGRLDREQAMIVILRVSRALAEAHARGIVHRDVKPANITLDDDLAPKLADFDLVGVGDTSGGTRTGALGTAIYAAPELLSHPMDADARADVFGLGMTTIFSLYGRELPGTIIGRADRFIEALSCGPEVKAVLKRATEWDDPTARYSDAATFQEALALALMAPSNSAVGPGTTPTADIAGTPTSAARAQQEIGQPVATGFLANLQDSLRSVASLFSGKGDDRRQAQTPSTALQLMALPTVALHSARVYLWKAKSGEAKNTIGAIARALVAYMEREDEQGNRAERFPPSAPRIPPEIPRGTKAVPDERMWEQSTWRAIRFMLTEALYFSYEIDTSPDGRTTVVRAIGDLAGDGNLLIFERTVTISPTGNVVISPEIITREESR